MRSNSLKQSLQNGALDVVVVLDAVLLGVAGQHQGQSAVDGDVAGGAEAVLQGEDGAVSYTHLPNPGGMKRLPDESGRPGAVELSLIHI